MERHVWQDGDFVHQMAKHYLNAPELYAALMSPENPAPRSPSSNLLRTLEPSVLPENEGNWPDSQRTGGIEVSDSPAADLNILCPSGNTNCSSTESLGEGGFSTVLLPPEANLRSADHVSSRLPQQTTLGYLKDIFSHFTATPNPKTCKDSHLEEAATLDAIEQQIVNAEAPLEFENAEDDEYDREIMCAVRQPSKHCSC